MGQKLPIDVDHLKKLSEQVTITDKVEISSYSVYHGFIFGHLPFRVFHHEEGYYWDGFKGLVKVAASMQVLFNYSIEKYESKKT